MSLKKTKSKKSKSLPVALKPRPPIVTVMGHVDHGKTTLLDAIRKTNLISKEHGGITQHIGAYQIEYKKKKITFIDTPGHAAFTKMRSYGAKVTDLVILVIAANDGIKPQTKECLKHIKRANLPFLVCINKVDLPEASVEKVKNQLTKEEVLVEEYGGDVVCVETSAKQKKGLDELLEMILLLAEMQNLQASPSSSLQGIVIDSNLDPKKGPVATVLVEKGILKIGGRIFAEEIEGKVKALVDENGKKVLKAGPSKPVKVLGFKKVPAIGAKVKSTISKAIVEKEEISQTKTKENQPETDNSLDGTKLKIILKTDTKGTLEAICQSLSEEIDIIKAKVGQINESDVLLALSTQAQILSFNVKTPISVKKLAKTEKVKIKTYNIIYKLLEDLETRILKILEPTIDEEILGEAEIIAEFKMKDYHIAGCKIKKGKIAKKDSLHLKRGNKIIADARIRSFQKEKKEVDQAKASEEIGLVLSPNLDFKIGDVIISYKTQD